MKKIALLLTVCLLAAMLPVGTLAEALENNLVEEYPGEAVGDTGAPGLIAEPEGDAPYDAPDTAPEASATEEAAQPAPEAPGTEEAAQPAPEAPGTEEAAQPAPEAPATEEAAQPAPEAPAAEEAPATEGAPGTAPADVPIESSLELTPADGQPAPEYATVPDGEYAVAAPEAGETPAAEPTVSATFQPPHYDPNGPQLAAYDITLGAGEAYALSGTMPAGREGTIAYATANPGVAFVAADGVVTAVAPGDVRLTATAYDGTYAECDVHVRFAPETVGMNYGAVSIGKGETFYGLFAFVGSSAGEAASSFRFNTSNPKVVAIDATGAIRGVKRGKAVVTATTYNGLTASCEVNVLKAPGKVTLPVKTATLGVGEIAQVAAQLPKNTASQLGYASEAPNIVYVDPYTGAMQGVGVGTTRIKVSTFNGKKAFLTVTVLPAPQALSFGTTAFAMGVGMTLDSVASVELGACPNIAYVISNPAVADFYKGKLRALSVGETDITATTYNGLSAVCKLIVRPAPRAVTLPYKTVTLGIGESIRLQPDVGDSATSFTYKSSSNKRVRVSADGVVTALKKGSATITVKTYNKKSCKVKVIVQKEPTALTLSQYSAELMIGEQLSLTSNLLGTAFATADGAVAQVDPASGVVTAVGPGTVQIVATASNGMQAACTVVVYGNPEWVGTDVTALELFQGQSHALTVQFSPGSRSALRFTSLNPAVATVSEAGVITGVGGGQTTVVVETSVPGVAAQVAVTVYAAPSWVALETTALTLNVGDTWQINPLITEGTVTSFTYASSDANVAPVSPSGLVTAASRGSATLNVTTANGLTAVLQLTVVDPWYPESVTLAYAPGIMQVGQTEQLLYVLTPGNALADFTWVSSNPDIISVSGDGVITANAFGYAQITAVSRRNPAVVIDLTLAVETTNVVLTIPARTTDVAGIGANLGRIDAIRLSAIGQIDALLSGGVISAQDASKRRSMVNNAFGDYAFPWVTPAYQAYWKAANSEGGVKDFQPDRVYYGLPYISGSGANRLYNVPRALAEGRYTDSGAGYYVLNQANLLSKKYCGNDCSGFVDAAIWGTGSSHSADRTDDIAVSKDYTTIKDYGAMRTGDLICKGNAHVVMFLYYASADKSKIMIIENGGVEPGTNTVHCIVMDVSFYQSNGYSVRRLASLG